MLGLAFDVGTTTLAASIVDRQSGERLAQRGALNPQRQFGADVISRMESACKSPEMTGRLSNLVNEELRRLAHELMAEAKGDVTAAAFAGNPAMEHLLLGLPVDTLARIPYRPRFREGRWLPLADLGWDLPVDAFVFPLPGGFVGGDMVAFLFAGAQRLPQADGAVLYLDLGTNGEIALVVGGELYTTSAAAGPAFEGGNLSCGSAALPGAISGVSVTGDRVALTTVGNAPPAGICGSGAIEAVAGMRRAGVVDMTGRLLSPVEVSSNLAVRVQERQGQPAFILHRDARGTVFLTQEDLRQVQLAKAAIRAGIEVLAARAGIARDAVAEVVVTGSFGARLNPRDLATIGILTDEMAGRTRFVEEGALAGVERMLVHSAGAAAVDELAARCKVVPLSGNPVFEEEFLKHMNFPGNNH